MTGWDLLSNVVSGFPPVAMALLLVVAIFAAITFVVGFSRNGIDFVRHGFMQGNITELGEKIDALRTEFKSDLSREINSLRDDLRNEFRGEMNSLRDDLRNEFRGEMNSLRDDLRNEFKADLSREIGGLRNDLRNEFNADLSREVGGIRTELETIKVNHFGHLKNFLTELTSIMLDKGIINNENKARLDNHLRDM
ncbi:MAG: apolipoprotein A1/A4/E family protein [Spirochaetaceae bacterium]|jgi:hypothetical protein|nr:apolipoprotein A1/A4/E family protein [Spirochaetaceae bacterium]